jgi:membrane-bound lytic murein transglycosylase D
MFKVVLLTSMLLCQLLHAAGQTSFAEDQEKIFSKATDQWLVQKLIEVNPSYFLCASNRNIYRTPQIDTLAISEYKVVLTQGELSQFNQLYAHGGCQRVLALTSLCDLYFPLFRKKIEQTNLPANFKFLPLIFSGLNSQYADEADRSGIWAMDFLAARKYHLRIDAQIDERKGGDITVNAALGYLGELYTLFKGDEIKTIIAYYRGVPFVKKTESKGSGSFFERLDTWHQQLIKFYVYSIQRIQLIQTENQLNTYFDIFSQYEGVVFEKEVQWKALESICKANIKEIKGLNPVYVGPRSEVGYRKITLMLEKSVVAKFIQLKDSVYNWKEPETISTTEVIPKNPIQYVVKKGDHLQTIAGKYNLSLEQIKSFNHLRRNKIKEGQMILIPDSLSAQTIPIEKKESHASKEHYYIVKEGDSLWKIAKKYKNVSPEEIMKWNHCGENLSPGQKLVIYKK